MAVASLELSAVLLLQSPKCWDCRYEIPHLAQNCLTSEKMNICKTEEETKGQGADAGSYSLGWCACVTLY